MRGSRVVVVAVGIVVVLACGVLALGVALVIGIQVRTDREIAKIETRMAQPPSPAATRTQGPPTKTPQPTTTTVLIVPPTWTPLPTLTPIPAPTQAPPTEVPAPRGDYLGLTYEGIEDVRATTTDAQWEAFVRDAIGKRVRWTGTVVEVRTGGRVLVDAVEGLFGNNSIDVSFIIPERQALALQRDQEITFDGEIDEIHESLEIVGTVDLVDVQLLAY